MKKMIGGWVAVLASATMLLGAAPSNEVRRIKGAPQSPILAGVVIPSGTSLIYLSGQVPQAIDAAKPSESIDAYGDTKTQSLSVFNKIKTLLSAQGLALGDVVKLTVYLVGDPKNGGKLDFKGFSDAYAQFFGTTAQPNIVARTTVQVAALANPAFLVEIDAIAAKAAP
jgi:enamine deaminase RidA (YjgF/YER057c/UK114 family)